ncbi:MAG: hypothetical protein Q8K55_01120 [Gemmatimonadaceae bacterium]|nr:hypothetical protein [Gemmatimonadaceae bacterium]
MTNLLALLAIAMQVPAARPSWARDTTTYESVRLKEIVEEAVRANRRVPPALGSYTAQVESEISIGSKRPDQGELSFSVEQVASTLRWDRTGAFEQRVTGYRSQALGLQFATVGLFRNAWAVPSLYGNRLALLFGRDTSERGPPVGRGRSSRATAFAIHPLAEDRERVYRYRGGDTVVTLRMNDREIPIVRVEVDVRPDVPSETVVFTGEVDLDAVRQQIVRMRGYFSRVGGRANRTGLLGAARLQGIAFVELVNSELDQSYWLPSYQRFEAQATAPFIGDARAVLRIVSRFRNYEIQAPSGESVTRVDITGPADTMRVREHRLTFAPADSMQQFTAWRAELGAASTAVAATDFDDVAPSSWRPTGPPITTLRPERVDDVVHVNRIEGIWTGLGITRQFREQLPGLTVRAIAGYAWSERTSRGRAIAEYVRGRARYGARVGRSLDITNDFRVAFDSGNATNAIVGVDNYDYVDRRSAMISAARIVRRRFGSAVRLDIGLADDRNAHLSLERGLVGRRRFRDNRMVQEGRYARTALTFDWRPDVNGELMRVGYGGRAYYERGDGDLNYQRVEVRAAMRWNSGRVTAAARADAGQVFGRVLPPQQIFELGSSEALPGYGFKEFAGDRAALFRGIVMYRLNRWNVPVRITRRLWLPSPSPALSAGIQAGWTDISTNAARVAIEQLGVVDPTQLASWRPVSRASDGVRATVTGGVRFFGGAVGVLMARPLDQGGKWRLLVTFGGQL